MAISEAEYRELRAELIEVLVRRARDVMLYRFLFPLESDDIICNPYMDTKYTTLVIKLFSLEVLAKVMGWEDVDDGI